MKKKAFKAALPYTLPICVGFLFLGMSYGFLVRVVIQHFLKTIVVQFVFEVIG